MFWVSQFFWISFFILMIASVLAFIGISNLRRKRLERSFHLEIINQGNVRSRYQIRVEDSSQSAEGPLECTFTKEGARLPELASPGAQGAGYASGVVQQQPAAQAPAAERGRAAGGRPVLAGQALALSGKISALLVSAGRLVPGRAGTWLGQTGSQMYRSQMKVQQAQTLANQAKSLPGTPPAASAQSAAPSPAAPVYWQAAPAAIPWSETPAVQPGEKITIDLHVRAPWVQARQSRAFHLVSRSIEAGGSPLVVKEIKILIKGGFWVHSVYPRLLVIMAAVMLLVLAAVLAV